MKKFILYASLSLATLGSYEGKASLTHFDGSYLGARVGYFSEQTKVKLNTDVFKVKPTGFTGLLVAGYGRTLHTFYMGGEVTLNYRTTSKSLKDQKLGYSYGFGFTPILGYPLSNTLLAGVGLSIDYMFSKNRLMFKRTVDCTPKIILKAVIGENLILRGDIGYQFALKTVNAKEIKRLEKPQALVITAGFNYRF